MLKSARIQRYKSLYDVKVDFEPLTVLIGPNGSGKSNICEALLFVSSVVNQLSLQQGVEPFPTDTLLTNFAKQRDGISSSALSKRWHGEDGPIRFNMSFINSENNVTTQEIVIPASSPVQLPLERIIVDTLSGMKSYDFVPVLLAQGQDTDSVMNRSGHGIANSLADILLNDRQRFNELEMRLTQLIPNVSRIILDRTIENRFRLFLQDKHSKYQIPATDVSDGTLRILAYLTVLYDPDCPRIVCFEEPENGIHPWLLNKMIEMFNQVSEGVQSGQGTQIVLTTHSPALLNYLRPEQIRAVEISKDGKTRVHNLPLEQARFVSAVEIYEGELGEMWFTDIFGGNPE